MPLSREQEQLLLFVCTFMGAVLQLEIHRNAMALMHLGQSGINRCRALLILVIAKNASQRVIELRNIAPGFPLRSPMARSNSPTLGHPKFPQAGRPDYDDSGVMAMRAAASLRR